MKLITLSADNPKFKTVHFNPTGMSLILGQKSEEREGGSNGSGKTLALELVHLCLGSKTPPTPVKQHLPDWEFNLVFEIGTQRHSVTRRGDGKGVFLNGEAYSITRYREWLNEQGVFVLPVEREALSFRSLFPRFARRRDDWKDPVVLGSDKLSIANLRALYLLGVDTSLIQSKIRNKQARDELVNARKLLAQNSELQEAFRMGVNAVTQIPHLQSKIERLQNDLDHFEVAENYRALEQEANVLTAQIRDRDLQIVRLEYEGKSIEASLKEEPDITRQELLSLYDGLEKFFKPEALAHLEAVEKFHSDMMVHRRERLGKDLTQIRQTILSTTRGRDTLLKKRDAILQSLHGKKALDEYVAVSERIRKLKEQVAALSLFEEARREIERKEVELKQTMAQENETAAAYRDQRPLARYSDLYASLASQIYPGIVAGLVLENNIGENQLRFDFKVEMAGSDSAGINAARIVAFDWLIFMHGQNHTMGFLWHDSCLFSDNDSAPRARWMSYALHAIRGTGKQYIVSLTHENFQSLQEHMREADFEALKNAQILDLGNAHDSQKLLGTTISSVSERRE